MALKLSKRKQPRKEDKQLKEREKITDKVLDDKTMLTLYYFLNNKVFDSLLHPIAQGKEAFLYVARKGNGFVAVKIFKYEAGTFRKRMDYLEGDERFKSKRQLRSLVNLFAFKEFLNLKKAHAHGIPVPKPLKWRNNVLVMEFIGEKDVPADLLLNAEVINPKKLKADILKAAEKLKEKAGLVHADLNEFNIMHLEENGSDGFWFIDMAQAVLASHPKAEEFYARDVANLNNFFRKKYGL